jgi:RNA polymerase sigma factor (sigma-70 family)
MTDQDQVRDGWTEDGGHDLRYERKNGEMAGLIRQFTPLISMSARKFEGRGAEREDLAQEGYLALIEIARRSTKRRLAYRLSSGIPWRVRVAASRLRRPEAEQPLDVAEEREEASELLVRDEQSAWEFQELEIFDAIDRLFYGLNLAIARSAAMGLTQREIAESMGVRQQAIASRLAKIRSKLREAL